MSVFTRQSYTDQLFTSLVLEKEQLEQIEFQNCQFRNCKFLEVTFNKVKFTECDFEGCDLSLSKFPYCRFSEVSFKDSKLVGINWTKLSWPLVRLASPFYFYDSNISHSSFYELELPDLIMEQCKAHDVDFREAKLKHASFTGTDFQSCLFQHTDLSHADFSNAINYTIDIQTNKVAKACFSFPEVIGLLNNLEIKIKDLPSDNED